VVAALIEFLQVSSLQGQSTDCRASAADISEIRAAIKGVRAGMKHLETTKAGCRELDARMEGFRKAVENMQTTVVASMAEHCEERSSHVQRVCIYCNRVETFIMYPHMDFHTRTRRPNLVQQCSMEVNSAHCMISSLPLHGTTVEARVV
jgi:hypothetical protein